MVSVRKCMVGIAAFVVLNAAPAHASDATKDEVESLLVVKDQAARTRWFAGVNWFAAVKRAEAVTEVGNSRHDRGNPHPATGAGQSTAVSAHSGNAWLDCIGHHESDNAGGYQATDAGHAGAEENSGRYSFSQSTWDATARHIGRGDLVGVKPQNASPADQDAMALALHGWQGGAPWSGSGCG